MDALLLAAMREKAARLAAEAGPLPQHILDLVEKIIRPSSQEDAA